MTFPTSPFLQAERKHRKPAPLLTYYFGRRDVTRAFEYNSVSWAHSVCCPQLEEFKEIEIANEEHNKEVPFQTPVGPRRLGKDG